MQMLNILIFSFCISKKKINKTLKLFYLLSFLFFMLQISYFTEKLRFFSNFRRKLKFIVSHMAVNSKNEK